MKPTLDVHDFCTNQRFGSGGLHAAELPRLALESAIEHVEWTARGRLLARREHPSHADRPVIEVEIDARLSVPCKRCLTPVELDLDLSPTFVLFESEQEADTALTEDDRFQAAVASRQFDLAAHIEDELLIAVEEGASHEQCPPQALAALQLSVEEGRAHREEDEVGALASALQRARRH